MPVDLPAMMAACRAARGTVYLVGAGPGDPDLLTCAPRGCWRRPTWWSTTTSWVPGVMALVGPQAERIYVGKERNHHSLPQEDINAAAGAAGAAGPRWCA
jgi:uroporphyrin-III C-methyltransferase/precorrin-2 dehydrogenase/sirohydrochlorin ferrochelatase